MQLGKKMLAKALSSTLQLAEPVPQASALLPDGGPLPSLGSTSPCPTLLPPHAGLCGGGEHLGLETTWLEGVK